MEQMDNLVHLVKEVHLVHLVKTLPIAHVHTDV
ncbi:unnamed protein product [Wuchereria bancrofti]|uniref:Uncharacterized protein n=1 Tax=Wuchereria bancrofti TaxID=6293 RepID=A0A3P7DTU7_WUCBA|nr:unnamed protein product [Wuchereria bancrofti]